MGHKFTRAMLATLGLVLLALPVLAHHSASAEFDVYKDITLQGRITKIDWINPHVYVYVDVKDASGKVSSWSIESWPTGMLHRAGISKEMLGEGQTVSLYGYAAKDGTKNLMWLRKITFSDGHVIELWEGGKNADLSQQK